MTAYGVDIRSGNPRGGEIAFTGWTPTLGRGATQPQYGGGTTTGSAQFNGQTQNDDRISKAFRKVGASLKIHKQVFNTLIGQVVGTTTPTFTYKWVRGTSGDNYKSLRQIDDFGIVYPPRVTTVNDQNVFRAMFQRSVAPTTYAKDVGGNGGGGKVRF